MTKKVGQGDGLAALRDVLNDSALKYSNAGEPSKTPSGPPPPPNVGVKAARDANVKLGYLTKSNGQEEVTLTYKPDGKGKLPRFNAQGDVIDSKSNVKEFDVKISNVPSGDYNQPIQIKGAGIKGYTTPTGKKIIEEMSSGSHEYSLSYPVQEGMGGRVFKTPVDEDAFQAALEVQTLQPSPPAQTPVLLGDSKVQNDAKPATLPPVAASTPAPQGPPSKEAQAMMNLYGLSREKAEAYVAKRDGNPPLPSVYAGKAKVHTQSDLAPKQPAAQAVAAGPTDPKKQEEFKKNVLAFQAAGFKVVGNEVFDSGRTRLHIIQPDDRASMETGAMGTIIVNVTNPKTMTVTKVRAHEEIRLADGSYAPAPAQTPPTPPTPPAAHPGKTLDLQAAMRDAVEGKAPAGAAATGGKKVAEVIDLDEEEDNDLTDRANSAPAYEMMGKGFRKLEIRRGETAEGVASELKRLGYDMVRVGGDGRSVIFGPRKKVQ